jgi:hypothetical protein
MATIYIFRGLTVPEEGGRSERTPDCSKGLFEGLAWTNLVRLLPRRQNRKAHQRFERLFTLHFKFIEVRERASDNLLRNHKRGLGGLQRKPRRRATDHLG